MASIGGLLGLIRASEPVTRARLLEVSGLSRPLLTRHLDTLLSEKLIAEHAGRSTGGRPPAELVFRPGGGIVLTGWLGRARSGIALADLAAGILTFRVLEGDLDSGPGAVLDRVHAAYEEMLTETGRVHSDLRGVGVGVPWPVDPSSERPRLPPVAPGWGVLLGHQLEERFGVPAAVDRDANMAGLAEYRLNWQHVAADVVYLKAGARISCSIVSGGRIQRGAHGASGEIGHVWVSSANGRRCPCGNTGCLDTVAGGVSLTEHLRSSGADVHEGRDVVRLAMGGDADAVRLLRDAGRATGEALAAAVNLLNPSIVVVGGHLSDADEFLAGIRETVYHRATAHATRALRIIRSQLGERAGLVGPAVAILDTVLAPDAIDAALATEPVAV